MTIPAIAAGARPGPVDVAMTLKFHRGASLEDLKWGSITELLDEADEWSRPEEGLKGLSSDRIESEWCKLCPGLGVPPELREFLLRTGEKAPFIHADFQGSYRPEHFGRNRDIANGFLENFPSSDAPTVLHRLAQDGSPSASVVVIACNVSKGDYYCIDAADSEGKILRVYADRGDLKEESMTMLEFLEVALINYCIKLESTK